MKFIQLAFVLVSSIFAANAEPTSAISNLDGNGFKAFAKFTRVGDQTEVELNFQNLPTVEGLTPYSYHIHEKAVDATGDCNSTGYHLDPAGLNPGGKNAAYKCDPNNKAATCELGDLSGKYGKINPSQKVYKYTDSDLLLNGQNGIIGRSVVIHLSNSTRIVCANIFPVTEVPSKCGSKY